VNDDFFRIAFILLFSALTIIRFYYRVSTSDLRRSPFRGESASLIAIRVILGVPLFLTTFLYVVFPERASWAEVSLPAWLRVCGILGGVLALVCLTWAHHALGDNFSTTIAIKQGQRLVKHGPYRWVRHPMYVSYSLLFVSAFLVSRNWAIGGTGSGIILSLMVMRLRREEYLLKERFGEEYVRYVKTTAKFFPAVWRRNCVDRPEPADVVEAARG
jgi:protein-S-isoprenylcysteine O-methyltransferase Ste14